jgi:hypothetical protein
MTASWCENVKQELSAGSMQRFHMNFKVVVTSKCRMWGTLNGTLNAQSLSQWSLVPFSIPRLLQLEH